MLFGFAGIRTRYAAMSISCSLAVRGTPSIRTASGLRAPVSSLEKRHLKFMLIIQISQSHAMKKKGRKETVCIYRVKRGGELAAHPAE
jgi:predicted transcriptional regulator